ncbi:MAG: hypothetical protein K9G62_08905 [Alphaproteobacteria bacterium]|nr:hypothetical protein [Alphaproteobacteria bacterium]
MKKKPKTFLSEQLETEKEFERLTQQTGELFGELRDMAQDAAESAQNLGFRPLEEHEKGSEARAMEELADKFTVQAERVEKAMDAVKAAKEAKRLTVDN